MVLGIVIALFVALVLFFATYKVVPPNEAHVIVFMGSGRYVKSGVEKEGKKGSSAYFYIPFLMQRYVLPLTNVKLDITNIDLNDVELAPFMADVITWLYIDDPIKAAERLDPTKENVFESLHQDLIAIVQAIARTVAMKQEIRQIMGDRKTFSANVGLDVNGVLQKWGVELINLEVNDIRDATGSTIIRDIEAMRKAAINSTARIAVATREREAVEAEQENLKLAETAKANAQRAYTEKQIEKDKAIGIATMQKEQDVATAEKAANSTKVEAFRVIEVGKAEVIRSATVAKATGEAEAIRVAGEKQAEVTKLTGDAIASAIQAKGLADAKSKDAMAEALKKFNDAGIDITKLTLNAEVQKAFAAAYAEIAKNAEIKIVNSGKGGNLFGIPLNAETGADLGQMIEALGADKVTELIASVTGKGKQA